MRPVDLTRFDFRALRFLKSEDVEVMTAEEVGQFVLLMCHAWLGNKKASLPNNPDLLAKYARCATVSDRVMREWKEGPDGRLYNETLSEEWDAAVGRSLHGARAARARWDGRESPAASNSEGRVSKSTQKNTSQDGFDEFWSLYPNKKAKHDALRAWRKVKPDERPAISAALKAVMQTEQWQKDGGKFVPLAATWLNGRRWEDEINSAALPAADSGMLRVQDMRPKRLQ